MGSANVNYGVSRLLGQISLALTSDTLAQFTCLYEATTHPVGFRSRAQLARFFDGFELVSPGIVFTPAWRPDGSPSPFTAEPERAAVLAGVGRKP